MKRDKTADELAWEVIIMLEAAVCVGEKEINVLKGALKKLKDDGAFKKIEQIRALREQRESKEVEV